MKTIAVDEIWWFVTFLRISQFLSRFTLFPLPRGTLFVSANAINLNRYCLVDRNRATPYTNAEYRRLIESTAVTELQSGGLYTLKQLSNSFLHQGLSDSCCFETEWREWYYHFVRRLQSEGIKIPEDNESGADWYVWLRQEWNNIVAAFAKHMAYRWSDIVTAKSGVSASASPCFKNSRR